MIIYTFLRLLRNIDVSLNIHSEKHLVRNQVDYRYDHECKTIFFTKLLDSRL